MELPKSGTNLWNEDYISFPKIGERGVGGMVHIEYFVWVPQNWGTQRAVRLRGKSRLCLRFIKL